MAAEFPGQFYPSVEESKNKWKRAFAGAMSRRGAVANVLPGSEADAKANAIAQQAAIAFANNKVSQRNWSPLSSTGDALLEVCEAYGITPRPPGKAAGPVIVRVAGGGSVSIPADFVCAGDDGTRYKTAGSNPSVSDGDTVAIIALDGGKNTEKPQGAIVQWESGSIAALKREAEVADGGLTGGRDADTEEVMRSRLIEKIANPGLGYNWAQVKTWAEEANSAVTASVYPCILGPSSVGVAIYKDDGDRVLDDPIVQEVLAYLSSKIPGQNRINVTSVEPEPTDVCIAAELESPVAFGGDGGGWLDARPWPNATTGEVEAVSYDSGTGELETNASGALTGIAIGTRIAIWDSTEGQERFYHYTVTEVTATSPITIKVLGNFQKDHSGALISADAESLDAYGATALAAMRALAPGEKSNSNFVLPRALRKPSARAGQPSTVNSKFLATITNTHKEITGLAIANASPPGAPTVPAAASDPPSMLTLNSLAFIASTA